MLELKNICYSVETPDGVKDILKNVSLNIDDRFVVITGPNGSGKSTLAKIIAENESLMCLLKKQTGTNFVIDVDSYICDDDENVVTFIPCLFPVSAFEMFYSI